MVCIGLKTMSGFHLLMESIPMSGSSALVPGLFTQGQDRQQCQRASSLISIVTG
jgi:hypothetical protein